MMDVEWFALIAGLAAGGAIGALYFAGLAFGIRKALAAARPTPTLMISAALRIAALLAVGWVVAQIGATALAGYAAAFLLVRVVTLTLARRDPVKGARWN